MTTNNGSKISGLTTRTSIDGTELFVVAVTVGSSVVNRSFNTSALASYIALAAASIGMNNLTDVSVPSLTDGDYLQYSSAAGGWVRAATDWITSSDASALVSSIITIGDYISSASASFAATNHTHTLASVTDAGNLAGHDTLASASDYGSLLTSASASAAFQPVGDYLTSASIDARDYVTSTALIAKGYITETSADSAYQAAGDYVTSASIALDYATKTLTVSEVVSAAHELISAELNNYVRCSNAATVAITIPTCVSLAVDIGTQVTYIQKAGGQVLASPAGGVTVNSPETLKTRAQFSTMTIVKVAADEWDLMGDIETSV